MMRRPLMLAAFTAVVAATVLTRAQGPAGTGAECQPCAVEVGEFPLPPQVEQVSALEVDADGNLVVAGLTSAADFPTTPDAVKPVCGTEGDAFVMVVTPGGTLRYSTCLGGAAAESSARAVPVAGGALWVVTEAMGYGAPAPCYYCFTSRCRPALWWVKPGSPAESWGTLLPEPDGLTEVDDMAAAADGSLWILATTQAPSIRTVNAWQPTLAGDSDMLLAHYAPGRPNPVLLTYLGGTGSEWGKALALAPDDDPVVEGFFSADFPLIRPALGQSGGASVGYGLVRLDESGRWVEYAVSFDALRVSGRLVVDRAGNTVIVGTPIGGDPPPDVLRARQHEIGLMVLDQSGKVRSSALLDAGLEQFAPWDLSSRVSHAAVLGRGLVLVVGSYWAEDVISGGYFVAVADASGSWPREPLVIRRPSSSACRLDAATSRGRDVYLAVYEWPPFDAQRKIIALRLRPGAADNDRAEAGRERR